MEEYKKELESHIKQLSTGLLGLFSTFEDILSTHNKNFDVEFKGCKFAFHPATTKKEYVRMQFERRKLMKLVIRDCVKEALRSLPSSSIDPKSWDYIMAFTWGVDPKDMQFEKVDVKEVYAVGDAEFGKSRPLNTESHYVQSQRPEETHANKA